MEDLQGPLKGPETSNGDESCLGAKHRASSRHSNGLQIKHHSLITSSQTWKLSSEQFVDFPKFTWDESISGPSDLNRMSCRTCQRVLQPCEAISSDPVWLLSSLLLVFCSYSVCSLLLSTFWCCCHQASFQSPHCSYFIALKARHGIPNLKGLLLITMGKKRGVGKWGSPPSFHFVN